MRLSGQQLAHKFANVQFDTKANATTLNQLNANSQSNATAGSTFAAFNNKEATMQHLLGTAAQTNTNRPGLEQLTNTDQLALMLEQGNGTTGLERMIEESLIDIKPSALPAKEHLDPFVRTVDTSAVGKMLELAKRLPSAELKSKVFTALSNSLDKLRDADGAYANVGRSELREKMTNFLQNDVNGIIGALEHQDPQGRALTKYLKLMYGGHRSSTVTNQLRQVTATLMHGPGMQATDVFVGQRTSDGQFKNAENLGYYAGATKNALDGIVRDKQDRARVLQDVFLGAVKTGVAFSGNAWANAGIQTLGNQVFGGVIEQLGRGEISTRDALYELAYPRNAHGGKLDNDSGLLGVWKNVYNHVAVN